LRIILDLEAGKFVTFDDDVKVKRRVGRTNDNTDTIANEIKPAKNLGQVRRLGQESSSKR
jgi:hypothetical protein